MPQSFFDEYDDDHETGYDADESYEKSNAAFVLGRSFAFLTRSAQAGIGACLLGAGSMTGGLRGAVLVLVTQSINFFVHQCWKEPDLFLPRQCRNFVDHHWQELERTTVLTNLVDKMQYAPDAEWIKDPSHYPLRPSSIFQPTQQQLKKAFICAAAETGLRLSILGPGYNLVKRLYARLPHARPEA